MTFTTELRENGRRWTRVWCGHCGKVVSFELDHMNSGPKNPHDALDVLCPECRSVIACLHGPSTETTT